MLRRITFRLLFTIILAGFQLHSHSQVKVFTGVSLSGFSNSMGINDEYIIKHGFHLGITYSKPISEDMLIESGAVVTSRGSRYRVPLSVVNNDTIDYEKWRINLCYIDVPLLLRYKFNAGKMEIAPAMGPYVGMGLYGKIKGEGTGLNYSYDLKEPFEWGKDQGQYTRFDIGIYSGVDFRFSNKTIAGINFSKGFEKIHYETIGNNKLRNWVIMVSYGYRF